MGPKNAIFDENGEVLFLGFFERARLVRVELFLRLLTIVLIILTHF